jgi:alkylation response protein AidB-like acyl-CoA dehydrogenase
MPFGPEHSALRESLRDFVAKELRPHADEWEEAGFFPDSVFQRLGKLGFLGLRYPEQYGGQGGDYLASIVLAEELARAGCAAVGAAVTVHCEMATPPVFKFGNEDQKQRYLEPAIAGEKIAALAISEPDAGSDVANIQTRAEKTSAGWKISGTKTFITNGVRCNFAVVVTRTGSVEDGSAGITLFLVDKETPGFSVSKKLKKLGLHASDTAELSFGNVEVSDSQMLGELNRGFHHLMWELQGERLIGSASAVSGAEEMLNTTIAWCQERKAFGKPIMGFQVTRHKLAELLTEVTVAKNFVYRLAEQWDKEEYPVAEISMCKLFCGQVASHVADACLQLFGGMGYMEEMPAARYFRDARVFRIAAGTDEIMKEIIAKTAFGGS